jgi:hypothetical protein
MDRTWAKWQKRQDIDPSSHDNKTERKRYNEASSKIQLSNNIKDLIQLISKHITDQKAFQDDSQMQAFRHSKILQSK